MEVPQYYLVGKDSLLRRLPTNLELRQLILLDGIRYAAEMIGLGYSRLRAALQEFSPGSSSENSPAQFPEAFADAWLIVDSTNRLRGLVRALPRAKEADPVQEFLRETEVVKDLRDSVQHLNARVERLVTKKQHAWGSIAWLAPESARASKGRTDAIAAGTLFAGQTVPHINPVGKAPAPPVDHITFHAHEQQIVLREVVASVKRIVVFLEDVLSQHFTLTDAAGGDVYISLEYELAKHDPPTAGPGGSNLCGKKVG